MYYKNVFPVIFPTADCELWPMTLIIKLDLTQISLSWTKYMCQGSFFSIWSEDSDTHTQCTDASVRPLTWSAILGFHFSPFKKQSGSNSILSVISRQIISVPRHSPRLNFSRCLQAPQVKHVAVDAVTNRDTDITVLECHVQHDGEKDDKKQWSQTTFVTSKSGDISPFSTTRARIPSCNERMMVTKSAGQPIFSRI